MQRKTPQLKLMAGLGLALSIVGLTSLSLPVAAGSTETRAPIKLRMPTNVSPNAVGSTPCSWKSNTLLVMPYQSKDDDTRDALTELQGTVTRTIGHGAMTVWVVSFPDTEHFVNAEKQLTADKKFRSVQRDYYMRANGSTNDPYFGQEWHLNALNVPAAWDVSLGGAATIAVIDTGVNTSNPDLSGKIYSGYDAVNQTIGQYDVNDHGTMVSTTAAAVANNSTGTVGPARLANIFPVRAGRSNGGFSTVDILDGFNYVITNTNAKLINFSVNADPPYSIANPKINSTLHTYMRAFHDSGNHGLIFNAAGNGNSRGKGINDKNRLVPYLIVVSAIGENNQLTEWSNYGNCIWFTAPGDNIFCWDKSNQIVSVAGTSFSSPLACSIAALIWGARPSLTNLDVETIMRTHCVNYTTGWNKYYGYGLPDALACVNAALGYSAPVTAGGVLVPKGVKVKKVKVKRTH